MFKGQLTDIASGELFACDVSRSRPDRGRTSDRLPFLYLDVPRLDKLRKGRLVASSDTFVNVNVDPT